MTIRQAVIHEAKKRGLDAFMIARGIKQRAGHWVVSCDHMKRYLAGEKNMSGDRLDHVLDFLGLEVGRYTENTLAVEVISKQPF